MNIKEKLNIQEDCLFNKSKAQMINLYIENLEKIERLNKIINTFEGYLENAKMNLRYVGVKWDDDCLIRAEVIQQVLDKLKELKESGNNE